ncbi:MAG: hypothetical protein J6R91_06190 [Bacteroidaceae bacterium]|nr:hypothetical protein [Bacteroidaceae bacterium]
MKMKENDTAPCDAYSSSDLGEYQARLTKLMLENSSAIFANYSRAHARCITRTFFENATSSISVLSGDFGNHFYRLCDIKQAVLKAIASGVKIRVISLCTEKNSLAAIDSLQEEIKSLKESDQSVKGGLEVKFATVKTGAQVKHYMVVDDKRYRLEDIHTDNMGSPVHAEVCCNGPSKASALNLAFNSVWNRLS